MGAHRCRQRASLSSHDFDRLIAVLQALVSNRQVIELVKTERLLAPDLRDALLVVSVTVAMPAANDQIERVGQAAQLGVERVAVPNTRCHRESEHCDRKQRLHA